MKLSFVFVFVVFCLGSEAAHITSLKATFIQPWLYINFDEQRWDDELNRLKGMGMDTLYMGDVATHNKGGTWTIYYESELPFFSGYNMVYNAIDPLMIACQRHGFKVFLGTGLSETFDANLTTELGRQHMLEFVDQATQIAEELYNKYKSKYPETYHGFYSVTEFWNPIDMDYDSNLENYTTNLREMFTIMLNKRDELNSTMPFFFSPYVNILSGFGMASINTDRFIEFWARILEAPFRDGDIICPMDSCGGGGNNIANLDAWTAAYRKAVDRANKKREYQTDFRFHLLE